jgi:undecaprenyl-diphosphatase
MDKKLVLTSITSLVIFISLIIFEKFLTNIDISINHLITLIQLPFFIIVSKGIGILFDTYSMIIISLIISIILWLRSSKKDAIFFSTIMLLNGAVIELLKIIINKARPINELVNETNQAFPSGHTTTAVVFFGLLTYLIFKRTKSSITRITTVIASITLILLISFSRLYLNVHWFTDILGGLALGLFILTCSILLRKL